MSRRLPQVPGARWVMGVIGVTLAGLAPPVQEPGQPAVAPVVRSTEDRAQDLESFDVVWTTIRDKHFDPTLGGLDWQAVRDELRPKVEKAETRAQARAAMSEALERLKQTHFGIIPSDAYKAVGEAGGPGETGADLRLIDDRAVVVAVAEGTPAHKAGVRPGWVLVKARDKTIAEVLKAAEAAFSRAGMLAARKALVVNSRLHGAIGQTIGADFLDGDDRPVHVELKCEEPQGTASRLGNLPTFYVRFTSRRVDDTVGYIALNTFFDAASVLQKFAEAIAEHRDTDGLVLDLRGNPGGIGGMAMGMGGWFVTETNQRLGTMTTRDGSLIFSLNPRPMPFTGPVAVLVDELSMSTSEILAGGLKDLKRARVFGVATPGAALPSRVDMLPNGDRFQYAFANYVSAGGAPLEGIGVTPDEPVPLSREALLAGHDPALEAATAWIRSVKAQP